ncbi:hypothetical protein EVJ58_g8604 [Rhodofomes roseus]|uniref:Uncharacterized protein n=1 Tax=Rhodofomes roseus TaxID=34475 RepID=A0A4Y9XX80_9APHY|nr:hypothetical protein EVJ58_g8604 [Rhodofomes roseus]
MHTPNNNSMAFDISGDFNVQSVSFGPGSSRPPTSTPPVASHGKGLIAASNKCPQMDLEVGCGHHDERVQSQGTGVPGVRHAQVLGTKLGLNADNMVMLSSWEVHASKEGLPHADYMLHLITYATALHTNKHHERVSAMEKKIVNLLNKGPRSCPKATVDAIFKKVLAKAAQKSSNNGRGFVHKMLIPSVKPLSVTIMLC